MNTIVLNNLDPTVLEKLQILSQKHNRTLEEEIIAIITEVAETSLINQEETFKKAWEKVDALRQQHEGKIFSVELLRENRHGSKKSRSY